jgi:hypothetical protein
VTSTEVRRDGQVKAVFDSGDETDDHNAAFKWLLQHQPQSVDWACRHEGWSIVTVPGDRP